MLDIVCDPPARCPDEARLRRCLNAALTGEGRTPGEITIVLTGHDDVLELNRAYLGHDYVTDVLSFWLGEEDGSGPLVGEVYVDLDTAAERCAEFGASFDDEAIRYAVHGLLHLCGYDDATPEQKRAMHTLEDRYLTA